MGKLLVNSQLGKGLKSYRKELGYTQAALAKKAHLAPGTVWLMEQGKGRIRSFLQAVETLGLSLFSRNGPDESVPELVRTLRSRRSLSQAELAEMCGVTKPTIGALERKGRGRLATLERVLTVLGAGAYLAERDHRKSFYATAGNSSVGQSWETPSGLLAALYHVFRFDLDPCSPRKDGPVKARVRFTAQDDGLSLAAWHGTVFVNPPYGRGIGNWIAKGRSEFEQGNAKTVVLLIPARTDTSYWHEHIQNRAKVLFLQGRLKFSDGAQAAPFPSALVIYGASFDQWEALARELRAFRVREKT
jgi:phage N-6-adenine-methyltransferase